MCIFSVVIIFSCSNKDKKILDKAIESEENSEALREAKIDKVVEGFKEINKKKEVKLDEMINFIDENINIVGKENGDIFIYTLEDRIGEARDKNLDRLLSRDQDGELMALLDGRQFLSEEIGNHIKNKSLRTEVERLSELKYRVVMEEGKIDLLIDYDKFLDYSEFISDETDAYLNIKARLLNLPTVHNGNRNISYDDLAKRLLKYEAYIVQYPEAKRHEDILIIYRDDLVNYLRGSKNDPVFKENGQVDGKVLSSYRELSKDKESVTAHVVRKYLNDLRLDENLEVRILSLINESLSTLEDRIETQ